jgi:hypothetical protein
MSKEFTLQELYDYITSQMTPEAALKKMLESGLINYQKLKFNEGDEIHPVILIAMCGIELGWNFLLPKNSENDNTEIDGIIIGTEEFLKKTFDDNDKYLTK